MIWFLLYILGFFVFLYVLGRLDAGELAGLAFIWPLVLIVAPLFTLSVWCVALGEKHRWGS